MKHVKKQKPFGIFLLDLLFPRRCPWCGRVAGNADACVCDISLEKLRLSSRPLDLDSLGNVSDSLQTAWACFAYQMPINGMILRLKFEEDTSAAHPLGQMMSAKAESCKLNQRYDVIVPVPISPKTRRKRGYNQSALLGRVVAQSTGMSLREEALQKVVETRRQMRLGREERRENVKDAYQVQDVLAVAGKRVLLVDDVITTGATLSECAKTLLAAGALECGALAVAAVT